MKSLVIPQLEYCCQLWNPQKAKDLQTIEAFNERYAQNQGSTAPELLGNSNYALQEIP